MNYITKIIIIFAALIYKMFILNKVLNISRMKNYLIVFAAFVSAMICSCSSNNTADENAQWRGENRDGVYNETGLLKSWPEGGPELLWFYEGLGAGFTAPAVANDRVYITGLHGDDLVLFVFNIKGELLFKKEVGREEAHNYPGPRSTVAINDGKLYIYNAFGRLLCLDKKTLSEVWARDLLADFDGRNIAWMVTESLLIIDDKIIVAPGGETHNIVALNKNTGETVWTTPAEGTVSAYCSPQFIEGYAVPLIVTSMADFIVGLNADTGEMLWSHPQTNMYNIHPNTPLYHNGMIFSTTGYREGSVMLRLRNGGRDVEQVWKNDEMDNQMGGSIRIGNNIFGAGHFNNAWFCIDWNSGETKYRVSNIGRANIISADGMLFCYSERGNVYLVKPNPNEFEVVSSFSVTLGTDQHWAHPVIYKGVLFIRHGDALMAYKVK